MNALKEEPAMSLRFRALGTHIGAESWVGAQSGRHLHLAFSAPENEQHAADRYRPHACPERNVDRLFVLDR
ncbi:MAG: hypothetical protein K0R53_2263 [Burkholderiales bacterium]|nr:hypothetical protein [Burkholderiales bacterium]